MDRRRKSNGVAGATALNYATTVSQLRSFLVGLRHPSNGSLPPKPSLDTAGAIRCTEMAVLLVQLTGAGVLLLLRRDRTMQNAFLTSERCLQIFRPCAGQPVETVHDKHRAHMPLFRAWRSKRHSRHRGM